jgi:hypothetical protein
VRRLLHTSDPLGDDRRASHSIVGLGVAADTDQLGGRTLTGVSEISWE